MSIAGRKAVRCDGCGQVVADESLRGVWFQPGEDVASWARSYARTLGWVVAVAVVAAVVTAVLVPVVWAWAWALNQF